MQPLLVSTRHPLQGSPHSLFGFLTGRLREHKPVHEPVSTWPQSAHSPRMQLCGRHEESQSCFLQLILFRSRPVHSFPDATSVGTSYWPLERRRCVTFGSRTRFRTRNPSPHVAEQSLSSDHIDQTQNVDAWHCRGHFFVSSAAPDSHGFQPSCGICLISRLRRC